MSAQVYGTPDYWGEQSRVAARLGRLSKPTLRGMTLLTVRCPDGCTLGTVYLTGQARAFVGKATSRHAPPNTLAPELIDHPDFPQAHTYLQCSHGTRPTRFSDLRDALATRPRGSSWVPPDLGW